MVTTVVWYYSHLLNDASYIWRKSLQYPAISWTSRTSYTRFSMPMWQLTMSYDAKKEMIWIFCNTGKHVENTVLGLNGTDGKRQTKTPRHCFNIMSETVAFCWKTLQLWSCGFSGQTCNHVSTAATNKSRLVFFSPMSRNKSKLRTLSRQTCFANRTQTRCMSCRANMSHVTHVRIIVASASRYHLDLIKENDLDLPHPATVSYKP